MGPWCEFFFCYAATCTDNSSQKDFFFYTLTGLIPHIINFQLISPCKNIGFAIPILSPTAEITARVSFSVGQSVMHSCCTGALLMGFRSSSERSDNGTMEDPALTILHLSDATIDHQFNC